MVGHHFKSNNVHIDMPALFPNQFFATSSNLAYQAFSPILRAESEVVIKGEYPMPRTANYLCHQGNYTVFSVTYQEKERKTHGRSAVQERRFAASVALEGDAALPPPPEGVEGVSVPLF
jgi:hypothetical protein